MRSTANDTSQRSKLRVFVETNVLISAVLSPLSVSRELINFVSHNHSLLISSYTIEEVFGVIERKFSHLNTRWDTLLSHLNFELVETPHKIDFHVPISDPKDIPILASVMTAEPPVDVIVTGDLRHFHTAEVQSLVRVYTPGEFLRNFT